MTGQQQSQGNNNGTPVTHDAQFVGRASDVLGATGLERAAQVTQMQQAAQQHYAQQQPQQQPMVPTLPMVPNSPQAQQYLQQQQQAQQAQPAPQQYPQYQQQPQQVQQYQQQQPTLQQQVQQGQQLVDAVNMQTLQTNLQGVQPAPQQQQQVQPNFPDTPEFNTFAAQFKQYMGGMELKDAVTNYQNLVTASQNATQQVQQIQMQAQQDRARYDLGQQWYNDPAAQQEMAQGKPMTQIVNERLQYLARVYQTLPQASRQQIDAAGTGGVTALWQSLNTSQQQLQVPNQTAGMGQQSSQQQLQPNGQQYTWSQIIAMKEDDFQRIGGPLLNSGNFIDDRPGAQQQPQGAMNYGNVHRTLF